MTMMKHHDYPVHLFVFVCTATVFLFQSCHMMNSFVVVTELDVQTRNLTDTLRSAVPQSLNDAAATLNQIADIPNTAASSTKVNSTRPSPIIAPPTADRQTTAAPAANGQTTTAKHNSAYSPSTISPSSADQTMNFTTATQQQDEIPPLLHFIYLSTGFPDDQPPIPAHFLDNVHGWQDLHPPYYQVKIWNNTLFKNEFPSLAQLLANVTIMALASDLLRYHVLEVYGGIYMDMDEAPMRSLDHLRSHFGPVFAGCEELVVPKDVLQFPRSSKEYAMAPYRKVRGKMEPRCLRIANGVIGTVPNHPVLRQVKQESLANVQTAIQSAKDAGNPGSPMGLSGPNVWTSVIYNVSHLDNVNILNKLLF